MTRLGRIIVGTTNYVDSLDDAVIRSGRIGRFIPVGPPDIDASVAILRYYLARLENDARHVDQSTVKVPSNEELRNILTRLLAINREKNGHYCGADLEEAVTQTFNRCEQRAIDSQDTANRDSPLMVHLESADLEESLRNVRRSVTCEAMEQFERDKSRYCGNQNRDRE